MLILPPDFNDFIQLLNSCHVEAVGRKIWRIWTPFQRKNEPLNHLIFPVRFVPSRTVFGQKNEIANH